MRAGHGCIISDRIHELIWPQAITAKGQATSHPTRSRCPATWQLPASYHPPSLQLPARPIRSHAPVLFSGLGRTHVVMSGHDAPSAQLGPPQEKVLFHLAHTHGFGAADAQRGSATYLGRSDSFGAPGVCSRRQSTKGRQMIHPGPVALHRQTILPCSPTSGDSPAPDIRRLSCPRHCLPP